MTTATKDVAVHSLHDQVVSLVAQRWAKAVECKITIYTGREKFRWPRAIRNYPDIVGWTPDLGGNRLELVGEVETEESISSTDARIRWRDCAALNVPFYLFVPRGHRTVAQLFAAKAGVTFNGIYEYAMEQDRFQLA
jgi:hypothetical protein